MLGTRFLSASLILLVLSAQSLQARTGDWRMVESLQAGTLISVKSKHRVKCRFVRATDDALSCEIIRSGLAGAVMKGPPDLICDRQSVREVRLEHTDGSNAAFRAVIGAGAGAVVGAAGHNTDFNRSASTVVGAGFGALLGGFVGLLLPIRHGKIIYTK